MQSRSSTPTAAWHRRALRYGAAGACLLVVGGAVAACSSGSGSSAAGGTGPGTTTLRLALSGPAGNTGGIFEVAEYEGYFAKYGLNIQVTSLNGGPPIVQAELAGKIDIGEYAPSTSVETYNTSNPLVAIGTEATRSITYAIVSTKFLAGKGLTPARFQALPLKQRIAARLSLFLVLAKCRREGDSFSASGERGFSSRMCRESRGSFIDTGAHNKADR